jgi:predicted ribosomally synthesized peptide with SipW-like signal peptide
MSDDNTIELTRRRILGGLGTIGVASAAAGAGTMAQFSDNETSSGNAVTAGTLNLTTHGSSDGSSFDMSVGQLAPGETKEMGYIDVKNSGSIDGYLDIKITGVDDQENGIVEPEQSADNSSGGELSQYLTFHVYRDNDPGGGGRQHHSSLIHSGFGEGDYFNLNSPLLSGQKIRLWFSVEMSPNAGNEVQSDRAKITGEIKLQQTQ